MRTFTRTRGTLFAPFALVTSATVLLTACGSGSDGSTDAAGTAPPRGREQPQRTRTRTRTRTR